MNSQEAWKRLANQLQKAGGRGGVPGGKGAFAGGGLLVALVAGGLALNASLFNGACTCHSTPDILPNPEQLMVVTALSSILGSRLRVVTPCPLLTGVL